MTNAVYTKLYTTIGSETKGVVLFTVNNSINYINASAIVNNTCIVTKTTMKIIKERVTQLDNEEFLHELFNDSNNLNGNKLRTFRLFKTSVETVKYVKIQLPRSVRRVMAPFRSGSLPLAIETGRYFRPQIHVNAVCADETNWKKKDIFLWTVHYMKNWDTNFLKKLKLSLKILNI